MIRLNRTARGGDNFAIREGRKEGKEGRKEGRKGRKGRKGREGKVPRGVNIMFH